MYNIVMKLRECDVCNGPEIYGELPTVVESDIWRVELNPNQQHLGRTFVGLRDHKERLSDLLDTEVLEYQRILRALELGMRAAFGMDLPNWLCLMNNAARDGQVSHVHWHMVPRYSRPVTFNGRTYFDSAWPKQYNTGHDTPYFASAAEISAITDAIKDGIKTG